MKITKIEVYRANVHCRCGCCDTETVYVPVARPTEWDGYPHYYSYNDDIISRHCRIVPAPEGAVVDIW